MVLPVAGRIISASNIFFGPIGSASLMFFMTLLPVIFSRVSIISAALHTRVFSLATCSEIMGMIFAPVRITFCISTYILGMVQNEPVTAHPIVLFFSIFISFFARFGGLAGGYNLVNGFFHNFGGSGREEGGGEAGI